MIEVIGLIGWRDVLDIGLVSLILYRLLVMVRGTKAWRGHNRHKESTSRWRRVNGNNLNGMTCSDFGYDNPIGLACDQSCESFETSGCTAVCGNGLCEPTEDNQICAQDCP